MKKRTFLIIPLLFLAASHFAYAEKMENGFKEICLAINKEAAVSTTAMSDKEIEENFARQRKLLGEWQSKLKGLIQADPDSIWADDAQYVICVLNIENPDVQAKEFEVLIDKYPSAHIEAWTKDALPAFALGGVPIQVDARVQLISYYAKTGNKEKAKAMYEESLGKYPSYDKLLGRVYNPKPLSETDQQRRIEMAKRKYNENLGKAKRRADEAQP